MPQSVGGASSSALSRAARIGACALAALACSSSSSPSSGEDELHPNGFPFVVEAGAVTDLCDAPPSSCAAGRNPLPGATTAMLSHPEFGKVCLKGSVSAAGYAFVVLILTEYNEEEDKVVRRFDANSLGIDQVAFTLESPPASGVTVVSAVLKKLECPGSANAVDCRTSGFSLMTAPGSGMPLSIIETGPVVAPFANFEQTDPAKSATFDTSGLDSFAFFVTAGAYDFCIRDFKFLDGTGTSSRREPLAAIADPLKKLT